MAEELKMDKLLKMLEAAPDLTALQRAIVTTDGTVQTMLTVIFNTPVTAHVISQINVGDSIVRWTRLIRDDTGKTVCIAQSVIPRKENSQIVLTDIDACELGIGQILARHKVMTKRTILGIYCDENNFTRTYRIKGTITDIVITEVFPVKVYEEAL
jgi:chorismate-pyruvate lyase